jgi:hypothetical protein
MDQGNPRKILPFIRKESEKESNEKSSFFAEKLQKFGIVLSDIFRRAVLAAAPPPEPLVLTGENINEYTGLPRFTEYNFREGAKTLARYTRDGLARHFTLLVPKEGGHIILFHGCVDETGTQLRLLRVGAEEYVSEEFCFLERGIKKKNIPATQEEIARFFSGLIPAMNAQNNPAKPRDGSPLRLVKG